MQITRTLALCSGVGLIAIFGSAVPADAQFYKGKKLNVVINYGAGGNTDVQGRTLMRYMEKYIPGKPTIIVRNKPGAGGSVGANYLGGGAPTDGSFMGVFTTPWMYQAVGSKALTVNLVDFQYVGAIAQQQVAHVRKEILLGSGPFAILKGTKPFKSAGHGPRSSKDTGIKLTLRLLGVKHEHVTGYKGSNRIRRAILQNEVQYTEDSVAGYYGKVEALLIKPGISVPVWQVGDLQPDGSIKRSPTISGDIPTFYETYVKKFGKKPSGLDWEVYKLIAGARQFLRIIILPKGAPKAALNDLRAAWGKTQKDAGYLAEYRKKNKSALVARSGDDAKRRIAAALNVKPEVRAHIRSIQKK